MNATAERSIRLHGVSIKAGERLLLDRSNVEFRQNEITLVVGPSGVGKSILLKAIAGLLPRPNEGIAATGKISWGDSQLSQGDAGVVFQSFALFDELSPRGNIELARDLSPAPEERTAADWLTELQVPAHVPTSRLSGGQRQRLAIARTLAFNPPIILYDEPTSGLDPATGAKVAELIRDVHIRHGKTTIVVTHDYPTLWPIADRVFLFDAARSSLLEVPRESWSELSSQIRAAAPQLQAMKPTATTWWNYGRRFLESTTDVGIALGQAVLCLLPWWRSPRWGLRYLWLYAKLILGPTAIIYLAVAGLINGYVTTHFMFRYFPYATYTEPLVIEELLRGLGFALYRIFVPVLASILVAARCGAAVAADIGSRQYGNQLDALNALGQSPNRLLLTPILWCFVIGTPFLNLISFWGAKLASLSSFMISHPERGGDFWSFHFNYDLQRIDQWTYVGFGWLMAKLVTCGMGVGAIAYYVGRLPKFSSADVSRSVTITILWATLYVLIVHFAFAQVEFNALRQAAGS